MRTTERDANGHTRASLAAAERSRQRWALQTEPLTGPREPETDWAILPDFNPCDYHAGHQCRRCGHSITDHEYIAAGLFFSLCPVCLASARQTVREMSA